MRLYLKAESDTHKSVGMGGNSELEVTLLYGSTKDSKQAVKVLLEYDPAHNRTWLTVRGPRDRTMEEGKLIYDVSRQVLPE